MMAADHRGERLSELPSVRMQDGEEAILRQFGTTGSFVVRNLFDSQQISAVRSAVVAHLDAASWVDDVQGGMPRANVDMRCEIPDPVYLRTYRRAAAEPGLHQLPHSDNVRLLGRMLGIDHLFPIPRVVLRIVFPGATPTHPHQDWTTVQGTQSTVTMWVPLMRCGLSAGPIAAITGSHRRGEWTRGSGPGGDIDEVITGDHDSWSAAPLDAGDAVVFRSLTVHRALPNNSDCLRLSIDFRIQDMSQPLHPGSLLPPEGFRAWDDVYKRWTGEDRKYAYFWRGQHPPIRPSADELAVVIDGSTGIEKKHFERIVKNLTECGVTA